MRKAMSCSRRAIGLLLVAWTLAVPVSTMARTDAGPRAAKEGEAELLSSDFNGDGFEDLAVGVPLEDGASYPDQGEVDVFYGGGAGLRATQPLFIRSSPGINQSYYKFGSAVATGDLNGDGYAELAIGIPGYPIDGFGEVGTVLVIPGSAQGLVPGAGVYVDAKQAGHDLDNGEQLGAALTMGDFDGDRLADLAAGAPTASVGQSQQAGAVGVFYGQRDLGGLGGRTSWLFRTGGHTGDDFGAALAAGDFNGDDRDDLAIGAPLTDVLIHGSKSRLYPRAGDVAVFSGSREGVRFGHSERIFQEVTRAGRTEVGAVFGAALAAGDFDGDGLDDLAIGAPFYSQTHHTAAAGAVVVLLGQPAGEPFGFGKAPDEAEFLEEGLNGVPGKRHIEDHFGESLVAANFGRGPLTDLAIGIPHKTVDGKRVAGAAVVMYAARHQREGFFLNDDNSLLTQDEDEVVGRADAQDAFGATLAAGSFRGFGRADLVVGVPGENVVNLEGEKAKLAGAVNAFTCSSDGCRRSDRMLRQTWLHEEPEAGDQFGLALGARGVGG